MGKPYHRLPPESTLPRLLLALTAISGEFPTSLVARLPGGASYKASVVTALKREKLLRTYYRDGLRGLRLTASAKKQLLADQPERFTSYLTGRSETNRLKSEVPRRLRLHRMAEVLLSMLNAGIPALPWEKPPLFCPSLIPAAGYVVCPVYYSSREVKEIGPQAAKINGSRSTGILLTDGGIFIVYNTGGGLMKWEYKAELRLKAVIKTELCQRRLPDQFMEAEISGIVFGANMEAMLPLMDAGEAVRHNYFVLDGNFEHFYFLTSDHGGEVILQLLCHPELKAALDDILLQDLNASRPGWLIENDAVDDHGVPVLFGFTCDMPRIRRFDTALELHGRTGTLICFDFQADVLRRICGRHVTIQSIDFEAFERSALYRPQEID